jgi:phosphoribosylformylglycinamidine synthase
MGIGSEILYSLSITNFCTSTYLKVSYSHIVYPFAASKVMAGHDISDGGLITCLLEMAFAGISGIKINITHRRGKAVDILFAEELGWVLEVDSKDIDYINTTFKTHIVPVYVIGESSSFGIESLVSVTVNDTLALHCDLVSLLCMWEETSYRLERLQANPDCVRKEFESFSNRKAPAYRLTFDPQKSSLPAKLSSSCKYLAKISVILLNNCESIPSTSKNIKE